MCQMVSCVQIQTVFNNVFLSGILHVQPICFSRFHNVLQWKCEIFVNDNICIYNSFTTYHHQEIALETQQHTGESKTCPLLWKVNTKNTCTYSFWSTHSWFDFGLHGIQNFCRWFSMVDYKSTGEALVLGQFCHLAPQLPNCEKISSRNFGSLFSWFWWCSHSPDSIGAPQRYSF